MKTVWLLLLASPAYAATVAIRADGVFLFDGKPGFPIGFTTAPALGAAAPSDGDAYAELAKNGVACRCGNGGKWGPAAEATLDAIMDLGGKTGLRWKGERATARHPEIPIASRDLVWITQAPRGTIQT